MKKKTGVVISSAAAIAVCASVMAGSTYALFTSESKTDITVKSGTVKVVATVNEDSVATKQLYDTEWTEGVGGLFGGTVTIGEYSLNATDLVAGDGVKFTIDVSNVGSVNAKYRTVLKSETDLGELKVTIGGDAAAYDGATVYGMWSDIAAGDTVEGIVVTMQLPEEAVAQNVEYKITYAVEAIQGNAETHDGVVHIGEGEERKDYLTLQSAFNAAAAGDTLYIDEDIKVYGLVEVKNGVTVEGNNHNVTIFNDVNDKVAAGSCLSANCSGLTLKDLTFNLSSVKSSGLYLDGAYMYTLENVNIYGEARHSLVRFMNSSGGVMNNCTVNNTIAPEKTLYYAYGMPCAADVFTNRNNKLAGSTVEGTLTLQLNNCKLNSLVVNGSETNGVSNFNTPKTYVNEGTVIDYVFYGSIEVPATKAIVINGGSVAVMHAAQAYAPNVGLYRDMLETEKEVYVITNANGLQIFANLVNDKKNPNSFKGAIVRLENDIDLAGINWTPIGEYYTSTADSHAFSGTFDGNNYTISNLYVNSESRNAGLFGYIQMSGNYSPVIKNLTVNNATVSGVSQVGAIVGDAYQGSVENCHVTGLLKVSGNYMVGGLVGYGYAAVNNCSVIVEEGSTVVGNYKENDLEGDSVGGLIGYAAEVSKEFTNLTVKGVNVSGTRKVGGLIGHVGTYDRLLSNVLVENVIVSSNATEEYVNANATKIFVGGVFGEATSGTKVTVTGSARNIVVNGIVNTTTGAVAGGTRSNIVIDIDGVVTENITVNI